LLADNLPKIERSSYINDLYEILRATTERHCQELLNQKKEIWHDDFSRYFTRTVEPKLSYFCIWSIQDYCNVDQNNGITTNQSEGFNFLIKDFQNWKEVPLDCLLMSLKLIQGFYLEEIRRGKAGLGTYSLKRHLSRFATNVEQFESKRLVCHPKDIVASIREAELKVVQLDPENEMKSDTATNSKILRAKQLVAQDNISFSAKLGLFTIVDRSTAHTVRLYPSESCSCPIAKNCMHIIAVKIGQRMQITDVNLQKQNLAVMRKNYRTQKQKPGRKRPRPGDVSVEIPHKNGHDCGLYAIANATALAYGRDPSTQVYISRMMRDHLFKCLEETFGAISKYERKQLKEKDDQKGL